MARAGLTVAEVIEELSRYPRDVLVVIEDEECHYWSVGQVIGPCGDEDDAQRGVMLAMKEEL